MLGGHSTLNTVVLGEGMSKYQIPPHTSATIAAHGGEQPDCRACAARKGIPSACTESSTEVGRWRCIRASPIAKMPESVVYSAECGSQLPQASTSGATQLLVGPRATGGQVHSLLVGESSHMVCCMAQ